MSMIRAPWLVGGLATSAVLLVAAVTLLVWRQGPGPLVKSLELAAAPAASQDRFPSDFGRLADLVPFAGGINPVAAAVVPVAHGPEYRDPDWVKSQSPEHWTLQVLASQDEGAVKRFLAGLENRADFVYFSYPQDGKVWFVVTTGQYVGRELALGVAQTMKVPDGARPFPRSMSSYQEALVIAEAAEATASAAPVIPPAAEVLPAVPAEGAVPAP
ncbi:MAG: SPOR domain-containing protein [Gammaproteobacteria bacterium]